MDLDYVPEQPVFGPGQGTTNSARHIKRYVRTYRVLQHLSRLRFSTLLDVGAAEGYTAALAERRLGARAVAADFRPRAGRFARTYYGLDAVSINAHRLPFRPRSFDVVISTETVEHLPHPVEAILEMVRVADKAVLVSTCEATPSPTLAWISAKLADYSIEGGHINFFTGDHFRTMLGKRSRLSNQFIKPGLSRRASRALRYTGHDTSEIQDRLKLITWTPDFLAGSRGIVALRVLDPTALRERATLSDDEILSSIFDHVVDPGTQAAPESPMDLLADRVACPTCEASLRLTSDRGDCSECGASYAWEEGVPVLKPESESIPEQGIDEVRFGETIARAGLSLQELTELKAHMERRGGVTNPMGRAALRCGRRAVQTFEGFRRAGTFLAGSPAREVELTV